MRRGISGGERKRELEIKEHELRLLEEQVGSSNAARVRASSLASIYFVLKRSSIEFRLVRKLQSSRTL